MAQSFTFELVSPERLLFAGEAVSVLVPASEGEMTVLAGHAPLVATLRCGVVLVQTDAGHGKEFFVNGGLVEINARSTTILAEQGRFIEDLDVAVLDQEILTAETRLAGSQDEAEKRRLADTLTQLREFKGVFAERKAA